MIPFPTEQRSCTAEANALDSFPMRHAYREQLDMLIYDLLQMADYTEKAMGSATEALLTADLKLAEKVVDSVEIIESQRDEASEKAFDILLLQSPLARELRLVVAAISIIDNLTRMGTLAIHVAKIARRRHPEVAVPEPLRGYISEMSRLGRTAAKKVRDIISSEDPDEALELLTDDDAVDDIHQHLFILTTQREWPYSVREAVDITLLSRYYERFSDHAVTIGERMVYLATGMKTEEYSESVLEKQAEDEIRAKFKEVARRYGSTF